MYVQRVALFSSIAAPIFFIGGTLVGELNFAGYDPVSQTISELAALTAPTYAFVTVAFVLTSICHLLTAVFTPGIGPAGRVLLGVAAFATFSVAMFPLPSVEGTSVPHRLSAMVGFILLAAWPLAGMRPRGHFPWIVRPAGAVSGTAFLAVLCVWFLVVWQRPEMGYVGVVERLAADAESTWPAVVVVLLWWGQRRRHPGIDASGRAEEELTPA